MRAIKQDFYTRQELQILANGYYRSSNNDAIIRLWESNCSCEPGENQTISLSGDFSPAMAIDDILQYQNNYRESMEIVRRAHIRAIIRHKIKPFIASISI